MAADEGVGCGAAAGQGVVDTESALEFLLSIHVCVIGHILSLSVCCLFLFVHSFTRVSIMHCPSLSCCVNDAMDGHNTATQATELVLVMDVSVLVSSAPAESGSASTSSSSSFAGPWRVSSKKGSGSFWSNLVAKTLRSRILPFE